LARILSDYPVANKPLIFGTGPPTCTNEQDVQKSTMFPLPFGFGEHKWTKTHFADALA
jgi:hypothetical protein